MCKVRRLLFSVLVCLSVTPSVLPAADYAVSYQGFLLRNGEPFDGTLTVVYFDLYDGSGADANRLARFAPENVAVRDGVLKERLLLRSSLFNADTYTYLEVLLADGTVVSARQAIDAVPVALLSLAKPSDVFNSAPGLGSVVAGGAGNVSSGATSSALGGYQNTASADFSSSLGGLRNSASGEVSTVLGGWLNCAGGTLSVAGGYRAKVRPGSNSGSAGSGCEGTPVRSGSEDGDFGSFVWSDASVEADFVSTGPNQFLIRAAGGVGIGTNNLGTPGQYQLVVDGDVRITGNLLVEGEVTERLTAKLRQSERQIESLSNQVAEQQLMLESLHARLDQLSESAEQKLRDTPKSFSDGSTDMLSVGNVSRQLDQ